MPVLLPADHAGIPIPPPMDGCDAGESGGALRLRHPPLGQRLVRPQIVGHLAVFAVGGEHHNHPVALLGRADHRPGGQRALVIGMGMNEHDGGHGGSMPRRTDSASPLRPAFG